jgi:hypothetical protein
MTQSIVPRWSHAPILIFVEHEITTRSRGIIIVPETLLTEVMLHSLRTFKPLRGWEKEHGVGTGTGKRGTTLKMYYTRGGAKKANSFERIFNFFNPSLALETSMPVGSRISVAFPNLIARQSK